MALNDVPLSGQTLGVTQPLIRNNFSTINAAFAVDHVAYVFPGTGGNQGKHNKVTFPVQGSAPTFSGSDFGIYNFGGALVIADSSGPLGKLTGGSIVLQGWSYWPTGALVKWGTVTLGAGGDQTIAASQGPAFSNQYNCQITNSGSQSTTVFRIVTLGPGNNFTINCSASLGGAFNYFIIGN